MLFHVVPSSSAAKRFRRHQQGPFFEARRMAQDYEERQRLKRKQAVEKTQRRNAETLMEALGGRREEVDKGAQGVEDCPICMEPLTGPVVHLSCQLTHTFHYRCLSDHWAKPEVRTGAASNMGRSVMLTATKEW